MLQRSAFRTQGVYPPGSAFGLGVYRRSICHGMSTQIYRTKYHLERNHFFSESHHLVDCKCRHLSNMYVIARKVRALLAVGVLISEHCLYVHVFFVQIDEVPAGGTLSGINSHHMATIKGG